MVDPSLPGIINNHVIVGGAGENVWLPNIKIDHSWTPNQITRGSYFGTRRDRVRPSGYEGPLGPGDASDFNNNNYMVSHSSVWSSSLVTEFRFAIAPWIGPQINVGITDIAGTEALGISGIPSVPGITPRLNISSIFGPLGNANRQIFRSTRKHHTFGNTTNWTKGRNQFKFGFTGVMSHDNTSRGLNVVGTFAFNNRSTSDPDAPNVGQLGHGMASFLLGDVYQSSRLIWRPDVQERQRMRRVEVFFQDDLKVTNKLTLNLGISYHIPYPYIDAEDNVSAVYLDVPNPGADGLPGPWCLPGRAPDALDAASWSTPTTSLGRPGSGSPTAGARRPYSAAASGVLRLCARAYGTERNPQGGDDLHRRAHERGSGDHPPVQHQRRGAGGKHYAAQCGPHVEKRGHRRLRASPERRPSLQHELVIRDTAGTAQWPVPGCLLCRQQVQPPAVAVGEHPATAAQRAR